MTGRGWQAVRPCRCQPSPWCGSVGSGPSYMARRLTEGKSKKEIIRCLKRYVAREVFAVLNQMNQDALTPAA
jgi:hypothetical protein